MAPLTQRTSLGSRWPALRHLRPSSRRGAPSVMRRRRTPPLPAVAAGHPHTASTTAKHSSIPCLHELLEDPEKPQLIDDPNDTERRTDLINTIRNWNAWHKQLYKFKRLHAGVLQGGIRQQHSKEELEAAARHREEDIEKVLDDVYRNDEADKPNKRPAKPLLVVDSQGDSPQKQITRQWPPAHHLASRPSTSASWPGGVSDKQAVEHWYSGDPKGGGASALRANVGADFLRSEVNKYGEMAQMTYDVLLSKDTNSPKFGNSRLAADRFFNEGDGRTRSDGTPDPDPQPFKPWNVSLQYSEPASKYTGFALLHADAGVYKLVRKGDAQRRQHNFVGYVAYHVPDDPNEDVDIVVAWRGSILRDDWIQNLKAVMVGWNNGAPYSSTPQQQMDISPWRLVGVTAFWSALVSFAGAQPNIEKLNAAADWVVKKGIGGEVGAGIIGFLKWVVASGFHAVQGLLGFLGSIRDAIGGAFGMVNNLESSIWEPVQNLLASLAATLHLEGAAEFPHKLVDLLFGLVGWAYHQLPFDVPVAVTFAVIVGLVSALVGILGSQDWIADAERRSNWEIYVENWGRLLVLWPKWLGWGISTLLLSRWQRGPKVSYGWKEMYAEADPFGLGDITKLKKDKEGRVWYHACRPQDAIKVYGSPQLQVYRAIVDLLESDKIPAERQVRITTTGHSLGGALATMCAHDLGLVAGEAQERQFRPPRGEDGLARDVRRSLLSREEIVLEDQVLRAKEDLIAAMQRHSHKHSEGAAHKHSKDEPHKHGYVPVTAVTFASPRVGGRIFAARFGKAYQMPPTFAKDSLRLNLLVIPSWLFYWVAQVPGAPIAFDVGANTLFVSLVLGLLGKSPLAPLTLTALGAFLLIPSALNGALRDLQDIIKNEPYPSVLRALRITNVQDVVHQVPPGIWSAVTGGRLYKHAGVQVMRDAYELDNFRRDMGFLGIVPNAAAAGQRHNLEMYLHLMDPSRRTAWINKGDKILKDEWSVPASWYVAQRAVTYNAELQETSTRFPDSGEKGRVDNAP